MSAYIGGWQVSDTGIAQIAELGSAAVPASAVFNNGAAFTPDGLRYTTTIATSVPATAVYVNGIAHRPDGAAYIRSDSPASTVSKNGFLLSSDGAFLTTASADATPTYLAGFNMTSAGRLVVNTAGFVSPSSLFTAGDTGGWWTSDDNTYLKVNHDGTGGNVADGGTVGRWDDRSGAGNHLLQSTAASRPVYLAGNGINCFIKTDATQAFMGKLDLANVARDAFSGGIIFWLPGIRLTPILDMGADNFAIAAGNNSSTNFREIRYFNGAAYINTALVYSARKMTIAWSSGTGFKIWINGTLFTGPAALAAQAMIRIWIGSFNNGANPYPIRYHELAFFRRALTDTEIGGLNAYLRARAGSFDTTRTVVLLGDSNTLGDGSNTCNPWHFRCTNRPNSKWISFAQIGQSITSPLITAANFATYKGSSEGVAILNIGMADINGGTKTGAETEALVASYAGTLKTAGMKVIVTKLQQSSANDSERIAFNAALQTNYLTYAHAIVDLATPFPDCTNATYFNTDNLHFKDAAHAVIAGLVDTALATL